MIEYSFFTDNDTSTRKIESFISDNNPKIDFIIERTMNNKLTISCKFHSEDEKDNFINWLSFKLNVNEKGHFIF